MFGAGAFGGWTALELARRGARVTLLDAWGPGNVRASSGGETRVMRATYGTHSLFSQMAADALERWRAYEMAWRVTFFRRTGALWMFAVEQGERFAQSSISALQRRVEPLTIADAARRYPQINFDGITSALSEPDAGYLLARRACEHIVERFVAAGGKYLLAAATSPVCVDAPPVRSVRLEGGERVEADQFVFACGPWLRTLFPDVIGDLMTVTRQEVLYFGPPPGDARFCEDRLPVWLDFGARLMYGIPGNAHRGFKIADDTPGGPFDPTTGDRDASDSGIARARLFLSTRFPALKNAPLVGSEVCQYESSPDAHFIIDRHPAAANVWIAGGGSGHGFKMGPLIGEMIARAVLEAMEPDRRFGLSRFASPPSGGWRDKWS